jgi:ATP-binding cassette subfamily B protein
MYEPTKGRIKLDQTDIRKISLRELREQVSYVPQDVFLFSDTVHNNIAFGLAESDALRVEKAARQAVVHQEILHFPEGYNP